MIDPTTQLLPNWALYWDFAASGSAIFILYSNGTSVSVDSSSKSKVAWDVGTITPSATFPLLSKVTSFELR